MKKAIYAGSFDPLTYGHQWVIDQGAALFDELIVVLAFNPEKKTFFSLEQKSDFIKNYIKKYSNVKFLILKDSYVAELAKKEQVKYLIRGIRNSIDLEYEKSIEQVNLNINPDLQTVYLNPPKELANISSSMVKSLLGFYNWQIQVSKYVNSEVVSGFLYNQHFEYLKKQWNSIFNSSPIHEAWFEKIIKKHSESHRYYHNPQHLKDLCLEKDILVKENSLDSISNQILTYTIFFHDIVYNPKEKDNEEQSVQLWEQYAQEVNITNLTFEIVKETILATKKHYEETKYPLSDFFLDLDLSILASDADKFLEYENNIRLEYNFVPEDLYLKVRGEIMNKLINPYKTSWGKNRYKNNLSKNMKKYMSN